MVWRLGPEGRRGSDRGRRLPPEDRRLRGDVRGGVRASSGSSKNDTLLAPWGFGDDQYDRLGGGERISEPLSGTSGAGKSPTDLEKVVVRTRLRHGSGQPTIPASRQSEDSPPPQPGDSPGPVIPDRRLPSDGPLVLGRYRLRRRLGAGAFATVWRARDERLDRDVAVKILPRERVLGGRFEREARAAARLSHPGIVTLYEAAVDDEGAYLVSELISGTTLDEMLRDGRLSDRDVVEIGIGLCDALAHAHAHGVIHRDVKPANVLVPLSSATPGQPAKLTDFGVARVLGGDRLTRTGDVIGTVAYMAPEQAQGLPAGAPADLFSVALVLYEALTGVNPAVNGNAARRERRLGAYLPPLRRQRRDLPRELGRAIDLALRPRPVERGSLAELRAALALVADHVADNPGVVASPWLTRTLTQPALRAGELDDWAGTTAGRRPARAAGPAGTARTRRAAGRATAAEPDPPAPGSFDPRFGPSKAAGGTCDEAPDRERAVRWPRRALAGVAAASLAAPLAAYVPGASPAPVTLTAFVAGILVAALPRAGWLALAAAMSGSLIVHGRPGGALVLLAAALIPAVQSPRDGPSWPLAAGAPLLGVVGLAGAWPGAAGMAAGSRRRVALAVTGWLWLALAAAVRSSSLADLDHVLSPLMTAAGLLPAAVWGAAALTLPWLRSRRSPALDGVLLAAWATALALATIVVAGPALGYLHLAPGAALLGAYAAALVALVTRWRAVWVYLLNRRRDPAPTS
jgi:eukaryotic-like serine/threonine-protein kinase